MTLHIHDTAARAVREFTPLTPGRAFGFQVRRGKTVRRHVVRCVPADFPSWTVTRTGRPEVKWIVFAPNVRQTPPPGAPYSVIADSHGVPVWWRKADVGVPIDTTVKFQDGSEARIKTTVEVVDLLPVAAMARAAE